MILDKMTINWITVTLVATSLLVVVNSNNVCTSKVTADGLLDCSSQEITTLPLVWDTSPEDSTEPTTLRLSGNQLSIVPENAFQGMESLTEIDLGDNQITDIDSTSFCSLPVLRIIGLSNNNLELLPDMKLCSTIEELNLGQNKFTSFYGDRLNGLSALNKLNLTKNRLSELHDGFFPTSTNLQTLILTGNKIETLASGTFRNVPSLTKLRLRSNKINSLPPHVFNLTHLTQLDLGRNKISSIEHKTFEGLYSLVDLNLEKNNLTILTPGSFYECAKLTTLNLSGNLIRNITGGAFFGLKGLTELHLQKNRLTTIGNKTWDQTAALQYLNLAKNGLTRIHLGYFSLAHQLRTLILSDNKITSIQESSFDRLSNLIHLDLSANQLSDAIQSRSQTVFQPLDTLVYLNLANNTLQTISAELLTGLDSLQILDMKYNPITTIDSYVFTALPNLQQLEMYTDSLVCDCKIFWLPLWLGRTEFKDSVYGKCTEPASLRGSNIYQLERESLICKDDDVSPNPEITMGLKPVTSALNGTNVTLSCSATTSTARGFSVEVEWRKDNQMIPRDSNQIKNEVVTDDGRISIYRTFLQLSNLSNTHEGDYSCSFKNSYGTAYSDPTKLEVLVFPSFTSTPTDVKVKTGQDAKFLCNASGHPLPNIKWSKDGGENIPAARERRFQVQPNNLAEFIIKDVQWEDQGIYSCKAYNSAGSIVTNVTLDVLVPPRIKEPITCKQTSEDNYALNCKAEGNPTPPIVWYKDGEVIQPSVNYVFSLPYNTLFIIGATKDNSGIYTCSASNTLGKVTQNYEVIIKDKEETNPEVALLDQKAITGLIVIAVVCCVVGTSLVWVMIIYKTRRRSGDNSSANTEETNVPFINGDVKMHGSHKLTADSLSDRTQSENYLEMNSYVSRDSPFMFGPSARHLKQANVTPSEFFADAELVSAAEPLTDPAAVHFGTGRRPLGMSHSVTSPLNERFNPFSTFQPNRIHHINLQQAPRQNGAMHSKSTEFISYIDRNRPPPDIARVLYELKAPSQPPQAIVTPVLPHRQRTRLRAASEATGPHESPDYENLPPSATMPKSCKSPSDYMNVEPKQEHIYLNTSALDIRPGLVLDESQIQPSHSDKSTTKGDNSKNPMPSNSDKERNTKTVTAEVEVIVEDNSSRKQENKTPTQPTHTPRADTTSMSRTHKHPRKGVHSDALAHSITSARREALADALEKKYNLSFTNEHPDRSLSSADVSKISDVSSHQSRLSRAAD